MQDLGIRNKKKKGYLKRIILKKIYPEFSKN